MRLVQSTTVGTDTIKWALVLYTGVTNTRDSTQVQELTQSFSHKHRVNIHTGVTNTRDNTQA